MQPRQYSALTTAELFKYRIYLLKSLDHMRRIFCLSKNDFATTEYQDHHIWYMHAISESRKRFWFKAIEII